MTSVKLAPKRVARDNHPLSHPAPNDNDCLSVRWLILPLYGRND